MNSKAPILGRPPVTRFLARGLALTLSGCLLAACGQKGPLFLPDSRTAAPPPAGAADELTISDPPTKGR
ncbi:MAG: hypothetical protein EP308_07440 [Burkholderiales bacterium]|nr:MAG: hypothetical protein EP308_07440 [Burkholderiales bacterium]